MLLLGMKYKIKKLTRLNENNKLETDAVALDEATDLEFREFTKEQELIDLIHEMANKNLQLVARRDMEKWGVVLYFGDKNFI